MHTLVQRRPRMAEISWYKAVRLCRRALVVVSNWRSRARQRDALSRLDGHLLADIGITRDAQIAECSTSFWYR
jgi:uncharacterized protein YjiS (DUF1127 family)